MLLALDTAQAGCSVSLWDGADLRAGGFEPLRRGHAEILFDRIGSCLNDAKAGYDDVSSILVTTGPGTFTGQRVGLAAARGLGLATKAPVIGLTTFEAIGAALINKGETPAQCHIIFDARRDEVYHQSFDLSGPLPKTLSDPAIMSVSAAQDQVTGGVLAGSGAHLITHDLPRIDGFETPDATQFGWLGAHLTPGPDRLARPFYLRAPDAKPPSDPPAPRPAAPSRA